MTQEPAEIERDAAPAAQTDEAPARPKREVAGLRRQVLARERSARGQMPRGGR